jgi:hypothetical protein
MRSLQKHIISIIIATFALIIGESRPDSIELDDFLNIPSTTDIACFCDCNEFEQEIESPLLSCLTNRTTSNVKRTNYTPKDNYKTGTPKKLSSSHNKGYNYKKPSSFCFSFSDSNLRLISFGKLII